MILFPDLIRSRSAPLPLRTDYLWRYFDIHKFLNLLQNKTIRFTRMDQFEDPQEGIPLSAFVAHAEKLNLNLIESKTIGELIVDAKQFKKIPPLLQKKLNAIYAIQKSSFLTCWFAEQRESVAMWNLYSNADGVAVKIPFANLSRQLKIEKDANISAYYAGRLVYQDFSTIYKNTSDKKVGKVALRKDHSFTHESEFRFVVRTKDHHLDIAGIDSLPLDLKGLGMQVICHPRMAAWKKKNIKNLLASAGLTNAMQESSIRLRG
ncbi:MAG: DUF2971 domain-containing protein [Cyclobacteriaceae bacterium]